MQPHAELVEGERQADTIQDRGGRQPAARGPIEEQYGAHAGEQHDPVIEVMQMRPAEVRVDVGNRPDMIRNTRIRDRTNVKANAAHTLRASTWAGACTDPDDSGMAGSVYIVQRETQAMPEA